MPKEKMEAQINPETILALEKDGTIFIENEKNCVGPLDPVALLNAIACVLTHQHRETTPLHIPTVLALDEENTEGHREKNPTD